MDAPNLFSYATSELSQDAFICWLLSWSKPECEKIDSDLFQVGTALIQAFFLKHKKTTPKIQQVDVIKQDNNIDVLCIVNEKYAIIIEDKTSTNHHSNQLSRYLDDIKKREDVKDRKKYDIQDILPIYFKTEDQSTYQSVIDNGYQPFLRQDILEVLNQYKGNSSILTDYRSHIQSIQDQVEAYQSRKPSEWKGRQWKGFYIALQKELADGDWKYVPNKKGGFYGFWWCRDSFEEYPIYLQLEHEQKQEQEQEISKGKLCVKVKVENEQDQKVMRKKVSEMVLKRANLLSLNMTKPKRFAKGKYMTVAILNEEYRQSNNGVLNLNDTVALLKKAEGLIKKDHQ